MARASIRGSRTGDGLWPGSQPLLQGGLCLADQSLEGLGLMDGEIGEHLAVHLDASLGEAVDKSRIGQAVLADTGVDTLDPERTEIALPRAAVAIGILAGLLHRLIGDAEGILAAAIIAFCLLDDLAVPGMGGDAPFYARHETSPWSRGTLFQAVRRENLHNPLGIRLGDEGRAAQIADLLVGPFDHAVTLASLAALHLARGCEAETLLHTTLGLQFGHFALRLWEPAV